MMRAKVKVSGVDVRKDADGDVVCEAIEFSFPSKSDGYPADGSDEDQQFARYTPSASLSMRISNPALFGRLAVGDSFYLDFTPV